MKMSDAELIACKAKIVSLETSAAIYERALQMARNADGGFDVCMILACMADATRECLDSECAKLAAHRKAEDAETKVERT